jgi:hypothetical protein
VPIVDIPINHHPVIFIHFQIKHPPILIPARSLMPTRFFDQVKNVQTLTYDLPIPKIFFLQIFFAFKYLVPWVQLHNQYNDILATALQCQNVIFLPWNEFEALFLKNF